MGVPSFYRWLVNKYPKIVVKAKAKTEDTSLPNPNAIEFDNLYLDLNGIIHPCFHPENDISPPTTYEHVFENIYQYIDLLFCMVRPRKLLFLAIDGVAPRAKMNQQRSRRFRNSKDKKIADEIEDRLRKEFEVQGKHLVPKVESQVSDSNVITPGTEFMYKLSEALKEYIHLRLKSDPGWKKIKVILSDSNVPGEGEHKIMSFVRSQRNLPDYDPNTKHCLYGLDADLIMLALATHEVHFSILREDVLLHEQQSRFRSASGNCPWQPNSAPIKSRGWFKQSNLATETKSSADMPYEFLQVWILREYLELDLMITNPPKNVGFDLERIIDDFLFICFFAGNDFLPHMPTLEINEGAIDLLMAVYKEEFNNMGGYLVDMQKVDQNKPYYIKLSRVEKFILKVGTYEDKIFKKRSEVQESKFRKILRDYQDVEAAAGAASDMAMLSLENLPSISSGKHAFRDNSDILENTKELKERLKKTIREESDLFKIGGPQMDKVRFGTAGWKERYYKQKFSVNSAQESEALRKEIICKYTEGLLWVLCYYFSGVPSWSWFYPYHYGPFASDLRGISKLHVKFQKGVPFKPFDQLMSVLPPMSANALPEAYRALMTDEHSRIIDFYPPDFVVDTDGKRYAWQGICKLPFIEEQRLLVETRQAEKELTVEELSRNGEHIPRLFARSSTFDSQDVLCLPYELAHCHHVPRLLEGVILPDKVVFENDITPTDLWHDQQGRRPNSRTHYQERERKEHRNRFTSTNSSSPDSMHKEARRGWLGRGRGPLQPSSQDSPWGRGANVNTGSSCYSNNMNPAPYGEQDKWKVIRPSYYEPEGTKGALRKPDPAEGCWSAGKQDRWNVADSEQRDKDFKLFEQSHRSSGRRGTPRNNNFWPSRNVSGARQSPW